MPMLRGQPFQKASGSERLSDGAEVFYCEPTGEIFSSYEDYFHRLILISSMVWSCTLTGKANLTYAQVLESEKAARERLKTFPDAVKGPFLLVATHTKRTTINSMYEDVWSYVKDRVFRGEEVDAYDPNTERFHRARIVKVIAGATGSRSKREASNLIYHLMALEHNHVPLVWTAVRQTLKLDRHSMTRDTCKLFLRQHVEAGPGGLLRIKESSLEQYVHGEGWTDDQVFFGKLPKFELSKKVKLREARSNVRSNGQEKRASKGGSTVKPAERKKTQNKGSANKGKDKGDGVAGGYKRDQNRIAGANSKQQTPYLERSQDNIKSRARIRSEDMSKVKAAQKAAEKKRLKEEKALLMQQVTLALKKYTAVHEDQELTDQRVMPPVRPVRSMIPVKHFGNFVFVLEFLRSFIDLLEGNRSKFPHGITMELLERALLLREVNGPLSDIFQVLLGAIFAQQEDGEQEVDVRDSRPENLAQKRPGEGHARDAAVWIEKHYCGKLQELPLDSTTLSEVLRLHILSSGALVEDRVAKLPHSHRGGYFNADDPGLRLVHDYPHILRALKSYPVYQLPIGDVIQLLCCLIHQLLTYGSVRELIKERAKRARVARINYQTNTAAQRRIIVNTGSRKGVALADMQKALAAVKGGERPNKKALQERMDEQCAAIEVDAQSELKCLQAESDKLKKDFFHYQIYLGADRSFRNYWLFESLPGLFVEHDRTFAGRCMDQPTVNITGLANCPTEMRRQFIGNAITTAASRGSLMGRVRAGEEGPDSGEIEVYEQLLIEGSAELERRSKASEQQQQAALSIVEPSTGSERPPTNEQLMMCTANPRNCSVHMDLTDTVVWGYYRTADELDALIRSLNVRGTREKKLREKLECERDLIVTHMAKCPSGKLTVDSEQDRARLLVDMVARTQRNYDAPNFTQDPGTEPNEVMEVMFRQYLLELELKISAGRLGVMRVRDRQKWREAIELRLYDPQTDDPLQWGPKRLTKPEGQQNGGRGSVKEANKDGDLHGSDNDDDDDDDSSEWDNVERLLSNAKDPGYGLPDTTAVALLDDTIDDETCLIHPLHESDSLQRRVHEMARALLQVEQCIDRKFLRHPFGPAKKHQDGSLKNLTRWEVSLMRSTCFAQLFLHYAVLLSAIQWSRPAKRIVCMTCRRKGDPDLTLLCDECNRACHIYCLQPKLKQVPEGAWFCEHCCPEQPKVKRPPVSAQKKKIFKSEVENDDEEDELENGLGAGEEDIDSDDQDGTGGAKKKKKKSKTSKTKSSIDKGAATRAAPATRRGRSASAKNATHKYVFSDIEEDDDTEDTTMEDTGSDSDYAENGRSDRSGRIRINTRSERKRAQDHSPDYGHASKPSHQAGTKRALTNGTSSKVSRSYELGSARSPSKPSTSGRSTGTSRARKCRTATRD